MSKKMNYKCSRCGTEIEQEPHPTIASCPTCGARATFSLIREEEPVEPVEPPVEPVEPPVEPVEPPIE